MRVVESDGHAVSMPGAPDHVSEVRWPAADGSITGGPTRDSALLGAGVSVRAGLRSVCINQGEAAGQPTWPSCNRRSGRARSMRSSSAR
jgi:hypothetical protein